MRYMIAAALALASCSKPSDPYEEAVKRYNYLESHGATTAELCDAARRAKDLAIDRAAGVSSIGGGEDASSKEIDRITWSIKVTSHCELGHGSSSAATLEESVEGARNAVDGAREAVAAAKSATH